MKIQPPALPLTDSLDATRRKPGVSPVANPPATESLSRVTSTDADVDMERVNQIRAALAAGTLEIDASKIADGLIESAIELMPRRGPAGG